MAAALDQIRKAQRADGPATGLAIGTATSSNCFTQADYPDYYFRITNNEHMTDLQEKFKRMCDKSMIKKRYMYLTEEILKEKPNMCVYMAPSLDARQDIVVVEIPKLAKEAATKASKSGAISNPRSHTPSSALPPASTCPVPINSSPGSSAFDPLSGAT